MTKHPLLLALLCPGILSAIAAGVTQVAMLRDVMRQLDKENRDADQSRVVLILYQVHRSIYPQSNLRKINGVSLVLLLSSIVGLIVAGNLLK